MKTTTKRILLISLCMMLAGGILTALGCALGGFPGVSVSSQGIHSVNRNVKPYEQEKTKLDAFQNLHIQIASQADIQILPSDDDSFYLEYLLDGEYSKPEYTIKEDTLTFTQKDNVNGFINLGTTGIFLNSSLSTLGNFQLTLYVPEKSSFGDICVYDDYGDITIKNFTCDNLDLTLESGNLTLDSVKAATVTLSNDYGNVDIQNFSGDTAEIVLESGNFKMDTAEINSLTLNNDYGNITLREFSGDTAELKLESGDLDLDAVKLAHLTCKNEYGNILLLLPKKLDAYTIYAETEYGEILLPPDAPYSYYSSEDDEAVYRMEGATNQSLTLTTESGDIELRER